MGISLRLAFVFFAAFYSVAGSKLGDHTTERRSTGASFGATFFVDGTWGGGEMLSTYDPTSFRLLYFTHYTSYPYTFLAPSPSRPPLHSVSSLIGQYGNDSNAGTLQAPFLTLNQARNAIRTLKSSLGGSLPAGGVLVQVRGRDYAFLSAPFTLSQQDSGTAQSPIV